MKSVFIITTLILIGCSEPEEKYNIKDYKIAKKYCISMCMAAEFKQFHHEGDSWGTGSSSMSGLHQSQIYDRVKKECVEFYKDEECCKRPSNDYQYKVVKTSIHGYDFGACNTERSK